ncbi:MAG: ABC transporter permease [Bacteroidia bacterium]|nr:ABC transporter permease [Bacteroidia bacterium]
MSAGKNNSAIAVAGIPGILLLLLLFVGVFASVLATDLPWYVRYKNQVWFPAFSAITQPYRTETIQHPNGTPEVLQFDIIDWKSLPAESIVMAPVPWAPDEPDPLNRDYTGPFDEQKFNFSAGNVISMPWRYRHWLGTDAMGNDLLAGLIHGAGVSLLIGLAAMLLAGFTGVFLGAVSAYFGNQGLSLSRSQQLLFVPALGLGLFWAFVARSYNLSDAFATGYLSTIFSVLLSVCIMFLCIAFACFAGRIFHFIPAMKKAKPIPLDSMVQVMSEIFQSIPRLVLIVSLAAIFHQKSIGMVIAIIGMMSWPPIYRYCRAEMLRVRELSFIEAARAYGLPEWRILFRHALPHTLAPVTTELAFLAGASIIAESSLSFLGIGLPDHVVTWGSLLSSGRQQFDAWWMVVFPGLAIFITVLCFNILAERIRAYRRFS